MNESGSGVYKNGAQTLITFKNIKRFFLVLWEISLIVEMCIDA